MNEPRLREYRPEDIPALIALWHRVFDDPEALAARFLQLLPEMGSGVVAELAGEPVGAAYIVDGLALVQPDGTARRPAYLYAVAMDERCRGLGLGKAVTRAAAVLGKERSADFICTLPASSGLYAFYERLIDTRCALYRREQRIPSRFVFSPFPLDADAYLRRREAFLQGRCHLRLSPAAMAYEQFNCECFGGGLFAVGDGIAAAYRDDGLCVVRELLCPPDTDREALAASVGAALNTESTVLFSSAPTGKPFLAAPAGSVPVDCVWNLAFD